MVKYGLLWCKSFSTYMCACTPVKYSYTSSTFQNDSGLALEIFSVASSDLAGSDPNMLLCVFCTGKEPLGERCVLCGIFLLYVMCFLFGRAELHHTHMCP